MCIEEWPGYRCHLCKPDQIEKCAMAAGLKPEGMLSFEKNKGSEERLIHEVERRAFSYSGKQGRILRFSRGDAVQAAKSG